MNATVQAFIDLIQRHEQAFYSFVHNVHSKGEGLFNDLMHWIELSLTVIREGLGEPLSLEFLLPHSGEDREQVISEIDKMVLYHYKLKVLYEEKLRRRFGRAQGHSIHSDANREEELAEELLNDVAGKINFGELVSGDAIDLAAQVTDDESGSEEYSSSEVDSSSESDSDGIQEQDKKPLPVMPVMSERKQPPQSQKTPQSVQYSRTDRIQKSATIPTPQQTIRRHRSLSLKRVRSIISLSNGSSSRRSDTPPVPPIPKSAYSLQSKPLPPSPLFTSHMSESDPERPPPTPHKSTAQQQQQHQDKQSKPTMTPKKKPEQQLPKPPELKFIPQLLPIFVEMVGN